MRHLLTLALLATTLLAAPVHARDNARVTVKHAWIRLLPGDLPAGGYATLGNPSDMAVSLVGASSPAYAHIMLHKSTVKNGVSHMAMIDKLIVPAHGQVAFAPGGYHLMLTHAVHPLKPGDVVKVTLRFANGSTLSANFLVRPANAGG